MYINHFFQYSACAQLVIAPFDNLVLNSNLEACRLLGQSCADIEEASVSTLFRNSLSEFTRFTQEVIEKGRGWSDQLLVSVDGEIVRIEISGRCSIVGKETLLHLTFNRADELEKQRKRAAAVRRIDAESGNGQTTGEKTIVETRRELENRIAKHWPRNMQELKQLISYQAALCGIPTTLSDPTAVSQTAANPSSSEQLPTPEPEILTTAELKERERHNLINALTVSQGRIFGPGGAAELIDMKPTTLSAALKRHHIDRRRFKPEESTAATRNHSARGSR